MELILQNTKDIRCELDSETYHCNSNPSYRLASFYAQNSVLIKITGGCAQVSFGLNDTTSSIISSNEIVYIEKGCGFSFIYKKSSSSDCIQIIELTENVLKKVLPVITHISPSEYKKPPGRINKFYIVKHESSIDNIFESVHHHNLIEPSNEHKIVNDIFYILSCFTTCRGFINSLERSMSNSYSEKVYKIILNNLTHKWTLQQCARNLHLSVATLKRKLQKEGSSFRRIYSDIRMGYALNLLKNSTKSVAEVAYESGFCSSSTFCTAFRKYYGMTPTKVNKRLHIIA